MLSAALRTGGAAGFCCEGPLCLVRPSSWSSNLSSASCEPCSAAAKAYSNDVGSQQRRWHTASQACAQAAGRQAGRASRLCSNTRLCCGSWQGSRLGSSWQVTSRQQSIRAAALQHASLSWLATLVGPPAAALAAAAASPLVGIIAAALLCAAVVVAGLLVAQALGLVGHRPAFSHLMQSKDEYAAQAEAPGEACL